MKKKTDTNQEPDLPSNGVKALLAAIAIQLTLGVAYIWSVFQTGIADSLFKGNNASAGLTFSLLLATLTIGSVIGGKLAVRYSTRIVVFAGGIILSIGFFLASFVSANTSWLLWLTYGVMGGFGMGFSYSTTIACVQKWYPHKRGFVTGIIVASLGFGGVIFTPIVESLIISFGGDGMGEQRTFMVLSVIFLAVCSIGSTFLKNPPEGYMTTNTASAITLKIAEDVPPSQMLKNIKFYLITAALFLACMGGLMMIGFAKPIAVAKGLEATATIGVLAISMFNSIGRLVWGMVSDKLGRKNTIIILLCGTAILSLFMKAATGNWVFVLIAIIGFFYGGFLSTFPSLTAELFGPKHMASNYGFVLLGFGAGAIVSSQIAGYYRDVAADNIDLMFPAFVIASCCAAFSILLITMLKVIRKKERDAVEAAKA
jgi:OFA family oxalate/formate antiporter-like MFS transporter